MKVVANLNDLMLVVGPLGYYKYRGSNQKQGKQKPELGRHSTQITKGYDKQAVHPSTLSTATHYVLLKCTCFSFFFFLACYQLTQMTAFLYCGPRGQTLSTHD
jgi:hypothetical protein